MKDFDKRKEIVQKLRPIDDAFFQKLMEDRMVCQEILRVILEDPDLAVEKVVPQNSVKNLQGRSVVLDALCKRSDGGFYNLEVQKADDDNHLKRVRYNASCITANVTEPGDKFEKVPDVCVVYISRFDMFKQSRTIYHVDSVIRETGTRVDNGLKQVFVNTKVNDGSEISELMECFESQKVDNPKFPYLSERVKHYKEQQEGVEVMCGLIEEYADQRAAEVQEKTRAEIIVQMLQSGLGHEDVARILKMSVDKVKELENLVIVNA